MIRNMDLQLKRRMRMSEFNLLDEAWISVVTDYKGTTKLVGMKEFFKDAHK